MDYLRTVNEQVERVHYKIRRSRFGKKEKKKRTKINKIRKPHKIMNRAVYMNISILCVCVMVIREENVIQKSALHIKYR